jgi:hypothetical protein
MRRISSLLLLTFAATISLASAARAQAPAAPAPQVAPQAPSPEMPPDPMAGMHHSHAPAQTPPEPTEEMPPASDSHSPGEMHHPMQHGMHAMAALYGPYGMTREASGTSWVPESSPHEGIHWMSGAWQLMVHGFADLIYSDQAGRPRDTKTFSENMLMAMGSRQLGPGRFGLRVMLSAEPWTIGRSGYPLVLQTGETADGVTPLVDRQHPHDLFMELAATYSIPLGADGSVFVYLGEPGEPALGPPTFMHRFSGMENPEAPLSHHWLDSTHISYGVATLGWVRGGLKLEGSAFNGHEPDPQRTDLDAPKLNSYSFRLSAAPSANWSWQASFGHLASPEQLEPGVDVNRYTVSGMYNRPLPGGDWQTLLAWGRNDRRPGRATNALLLESTLARGERHTLLGRVERLENDELLAGRRIATVGKLSLGYIHDAFSLPVRASASAPAAGSLRAGAGILGSLSRVPPELAPRYGNRSLFSWMAFLRLKVAGPPAGERMAM